MSDEKATAATTAAPAETKGKAKVKAEAPATEGGSKEAKENLPAPEGVDQKPRSKEQFYRIMAGRLNRKVDESFKPVADRVLKKHGEEIKIRQVFGDQDSRDILVLCFQGLFDILLQPDKENQYKEVSVGIPGGFGSLQLTTAGATTKKTPQGQTVEVLKRWRVKYSPGKAVDGRLGQLPAPPPDEEPAPATPAAPEAAATTPATATK